MLTVPCMTGLAVYGYGAYDCSRRAPIASVELVRAMKRGLVVSSTSGCTASGGSSITASNTTGADDGAGGAGTAEPTALGTHVATRAVASKLARVGASVAGRRRTVTAARWCMMYPRAASARSIAARVAIEVPPHGASSSAICRGGSGTLRPRVTGSASPCPQRGAEERGSCHVVVERCVRVRCDVTHPQCARADISSLKQRERTSFLLAISAPFLR